MGVVSTFPQYAFCRGTSRRKDDMLFHTDSITGKSESFLFGNDQTSLGGDACSKRLLTICIECSGEIQKLAAA